MTKKGKTAAYKMNHARILLKADINQEGGDLSPNHQLAAYQAAIDEEVETSQSSIYAPFSPVP